MSSENVQKYMIVQIPFFADQICQNTTEPKDFWKARLNTRNTPNLHFKPDNVPILHRLSFTMLQQQQANPIHALDCWQHVRHVWHALSTRHGQPTQTLWSARWLKRCLNLKHDFLHTIFFCLGPRATLIAVSTVAFALVRNQLHQDHLRQGKEHKQWYCNSLLEHLALKMMFSKKIVHAAILQECLAPWLYAVFFPKVILPGFAEVSFSPHSIVGFLFLSLHPAAPPSPAAPLPDITHSTSHTRYHTLDITHSTSHTRHHTTDITHSTSHTRHPHTRHHTLNITHPTSHNWHHTPNITQLTSHTQHHTLDITHSISHNWHHTLHITHPISTHSTTHTQHHTPNITHSTSHIRHHTPNITHSISHTQYHTLDITHPISDIRHHTLNITEYHTSNITYSISLCHCHLHSIGGSAIALATIDALERRLCCVCPCHCDLQSASIVASAAEPPRLQITKTETHARKPTLQGVNHGKCNSRAAYRAQITMAGYTRKLAHQDVNRGNSRASYRLQITMAGTRQRVDAPRRQSWQAQQQSFLTGTHTKAGAPSFFLKSAGARNKWSQSPI